MNRSVVHFLRRAALVVGVTAAGCSTPPGGVATTSPTPVPEILAAAGGTVRFAKATISPPSVAAGTTNSMTVTVTNCDVAACDSTHATTSSQAMGSASIAVAAGFAVNAGSFSVSASGGKTWNASLVSGSIRLVPTNGTQKLDPGQSVSVTFSATAACANGAPEWTSVGYNGTDFTTAYTAFGSQPSSTVTGTCVVGCTKGQGFWKNTPGAWPVSSVTLGTVSYSQAQLLNIFGTPVAGNGLISLAHQLTAAKLNIANGVDGSAIASTIAAADGLIGSLVVPPVGSGFLSPSATGALIQALDNYNSGLAGPPACP